MIMVASSSALFLTCAAFISYDSYTFRIAKVEDVATLADIIGSNSAGARSRIKTPIRRGRVLRALRSNKQISEAASMTGNARYPQSTGEISKQRSLVRGRSQETETGSRISV
jgi:hypothetical protein